MTRYASNDVPVTDEELGRPVTPYERMDAIRRQSEAFDKDDLMDVLYEHGASLIDVMKEHDYTLIGAFMCYKRKETIARRASMELYGKPDVIKASEVVS